MIEVLKRRSVPGVGTVFVGRLPGGLVEFVDGLAEGRGRRDKWVIGVSTMYGCPVRCVFCDAAHSYSGRVSAEGLLEQVRAVLDLHPEDIQVCAKLKVHFQRMGEPSLSGEVLTAIAALPSLLERRRFWPCIASVAPVGSERWFEDLLGLRRAMRDATFQLQFSINSTDPVVRRRIMPAKLLPLRWVADYTRSFYEAGQRKPCLNFALAHGWPLDADTILRLFDPSKVLIKVTPLNPTVMGARHGLRSMLGSGETEKLDKELDVLRRAGFECLWDWGNVLDNVLGSNCGQSIRAMTNRG